MEIRAGAPVVVTTASGDKLSMRALGAPRRGRDFPVVWVCSQEEYMAAEPPDVPRGIPWPLTDVELDQDGDQLAA